MRFERYRREARAILHLGGPLIAAQLAQISMGFVDTMMAGRLSARDLAAVAIGANIFWPVSFAWAGVLIAVSPTVSHLFGAGQRERIGHTVRQGLWLAGLLGTGAFVSLHYSPLLLKFAGVSAELIPTTTGFLHAVAWGAPGLCAFNVLRSYSEGISLTRPVMYTSLVALLGNIVGDYVFMYGKLGMPKLGAVGCGVASAIVMWMNAALMLAHILTRKQYAADKVFFNFEGPRWPELRSLLKLGIPMSMSWFLEASLFGTIALIMGTLGTPIVAGHQIALNVASITFMIPLGLAMAITVRVGQAMGRQDAEAARFSGLTGISLAGSFMAVSALCIFAFSRFIARVYTQDPAVLEVAVTLLFMAAVFQISDGLQVAAAGALRGLKDTKFPMIITFIAYWLIGMPLGYLLGIVLGGGARAMWIGIICGLTTAAILLNARFWVLTRRMYKK